ncbi:MAG: hypothetical protein PWP34_525 [Desulfuromonadales bacterium]|nr:hypothetical protein [Desulfuromonadales bacterium]
MPETDIWTAKAHARNGKLFLTEADARFIHIYRNGLEVARSIEKASEKGGWFGSGLL